VTPEVWLLLVGGLVLLLLAWTVWTLVRLGRLEARVDRAWIALDAQLQRRAGLAEELARDHPAAVGADRADYLAAFAADARKPGDGDRELAENLLGRELRELMRYLTDLPSALRADLAGTTTRIGLARRFYNDAVRDTAALRQRRLPRLMRLHASRPLPRYFDIDDRLDGVVADVDGAGQRGS
jgi:hypothetical protein